MALKFGQIVVSKQNEHPVAQINSDEAVVITSKKYPKSGDKTIPIEKSDVTGGFKIHRNGSFLSKMVVANNSGRIIGQFTKNGQKKLSNFVKKL